MKEIPQIVQIKINRKLVFFDKGDGTVIPCYFPEEVGDIIIMESKTRRITTNRAGLARTNEVLTRNWKQNGPIQFDRTSYKDPDTPCRIYPKNRRPRDLDNPYHIDYICGQGGWLPGSVMYDYTNNLTLK